MTTKRSGLSLGLLAMATTGAAAQFAGFADPVLFDVPGTPRSIAAADFDGDGDLDVACGIVAAGTFDDVAILLNDGTGSFSPAPGSPVDVGSEPFIVAEDLNQDGDIDIFIANRGTLDVSYLLGNGDGTFQSEDIVFGAFGAPADIATGDLNKDGKMDVAIADTGNDRVHVLLQTNAGPTFVTYSTSFFSTLDLLSPAGQGPIDIAIADTNLDGNLDILTANGGSGDIGNYGGTGAGNFFTGDLAGFTETALDPVHLALGRINDDAFPDVVTAETDGGGVGVAGIYNNPADGSNPVFTFGGVLLGGTVPSGVALGDLEMEEAGDGDLDIVLSNTTSDDVKVWLNNGGGFFTDAGFFSAGDGAADVALGDVDGDGDLDAIVGDGISQTVAVLLNNSVVIGGPPPVAEITSPDNFGTEAGCICDGIVPVTGIADVPGGVFGQYTLEYRPVSSSAFTTIATSSTAVPSPGGTLANWNTTSLAEGLYLLRLEAESQSGLSTTDEKVVLLSKEFNTVSFFAAANVAGTTEPIAVDIVGGTVCAFGSVSDGGCGPIEYMIEVTPADENDFQPIDPDNPIYFGGGSGVTLGTWNSTTVADGDYILRTSAINGCDAMKEAQIDVTVDNTPPVAVLDTPTACEYIAPGTVIDFFGEVSDTNLSGWSISYLGGTNATWQTIATGSTNETGLLASWDTTGLEPCAYVVRLIASDQAAVSCTGGGNSTVVYVPFDLRCQADVNEDGLLNVIDFVTYQGLFTAGCP